MKKTRQANENAESTEIFTPFEYRILTQALYDYMMSVDRARLPLMIDGASDRATREFYDKIHDLYTKVVHMAPEDQIT